MGKQTNDNISLSVRETRAHEYTTNLLLFRPKDRINVIRPLDSDRTTELSKYDVLPTGVCNGQGRQILNEDQFIRREGAQRDAEQKGKLQTAGG